MDRLPPMGPVARFRSWRSARKDPLEKRVRRANRGRLSGQLDEFGLPIEWRRIDELENEYEGFAKSWETWEVWCRAGGCRTFPAHLDDLVAFLRDPPVKSETLEAVLDAISHRHDRVYWNINANPADTLRLHGAHLLEDGTMFIPPEVSGGT